MNASELYLNEFSFVGRTCASITQGEQTTSFQLTVPDPRLESDCIKFDFGISSQIFMPLFPDETVLYVEGYMMYYPWEPTTMMITAYQIIEV